MRSANVAEFMSRIESNPKRQYLMQRILAIRDEFAEEIIIPNEQVIRKRFEIMVGPTAKPRHMRDVGHLMSIIKAIALMNVWHRRQGDEIVAAQTDVEEAFKLWGYFMESLQLGVSPALLNFYRDFILMAYYEKKTNSGLLGKEQAMMEHERSIGISRLELGKYYRSIMDKPLQDEYLRKEVLPQLENSGLIQQAAPNDGGDKRSKYIYPQVFFDEQENNIGDTSVPTPEDEKTDIIDTVNKIFPT